MTEQTLNQARGSEADLNATLEDFHRIFNEDLNGLYQLSFLLTHDHGKAEQCFVAGFEACVEENTVFCEWARTWAKRTIVQNAIRELKPRPRQSHSSLPTAVSPYVGQLPTGSSGHFELQAILALEDFERFVFVMAVLEQYSEHDCALLLECSVPEIREARTRAFNELMNSRHSGYPQHQVFTQEKK
jgi:DNA-directed RNA polymerase specialized sigma24 family protein